VSKNGQNALEISSKIIPEALPHTESLQHKEQSVSGTRA
jgi:hypothetical protein